MKTYNLSLDGYVRFEDDDVISIRKIPVTHKGSQESIGVTLKSAGWFCVHIKHWDDLAKLFNVNQIMKKHPSIG